jgi:hypothetical protein
MTLSVITNALTYVQVSHEMDSDMVIIHEMDSDMDYDHQGICFYFLAKL